MALTATQVHQFYVGYYGRPADTAGLAYWQAQTEAAALTGFSGGAEFTSQYAGLSTTAQVTKVYANLLGRTPDAGGLAYWSGELTAGRETIGSLLLTVIKSALGKDVTTIADRVQYSTDFAAALDTLAEINAYNGAAANALARTAMGAIVATAVDDHASLTTAAAAINTTIIGITNAGVSGSAFVLTTSTTTPDSPLLTAGNDTVTGGAGTLQSTDRLIDSSITDTDVLNASVSGYTAAAVTPTIINVENLNITGLYTATGFDLTNTVGAKTLTLATEIAGGTATVTDVSQSKAQTIASGTNIGTLTVTALAAGTGGNVVVNSGVATTTNVTGGAGNDTFTVNVPAAATVVLNDTGATTGDNFTVNLSGGLNTFTMTTGGAIEVLNLNSGTAANTLTLTSAAALAGTATGNKIVVGGSKDLTIAGDLNAITTGAGSLSANVAIEKASGAGLVTFNATAATATATIFTNKAAIDALKLGVDVTTLTVNQGTKLQVNTTQTAAVFNVGDTTSTALALGSGTLNLDVLNATNTKITTGAAVGTVNLTANTVNTAIATLDTAANATGVDTVSISGSKNVTIGATDWAHTGGDVISASTLTGILTVTVNAIDLDDAIVIGGTNNDTITFGAVTGTTSVARGGLGNDTLNAATATTKVSLYGDAGDDIITGGIGSDLLMGGDGNDIISRGTAGAASGADTMVGGLGNDKFVVNYTHTAAVTEVASITDFVAGTDKITDAAANTVAATVLKNVTSLSATNQALVDATADSVAAANLVLNNMAAYSGAAYTGAVNDVTVFTYKGDTYALINAAADVAVTAAADSLVKITGVTGTLSAADFLVS